MCFENWALLDLRRRSTGFGPYDGERIVLHMVPKTRGAVRTVHGWNIFHRAGKELVY